MIIRLSIARKMIFSSIYFTLFPRAKKWQRTCAAFLPTPLLPRTSSPRAERSDGATPQKLESRSDTIFIQGFSEKKVRTLTKKQHNFAESEKSSEKGEGKIPSGGRGGIPPQTPPAASPAFLLAVLGISGTNAKGARGEKTRARSRGWERNEI